MSSVYDHPEWREFVKRVREAPADDTARLVAADWLDERGESARAELIRAQIALTREPEFSHRAGDEVQTESGLWTYAWHDKPNPERPRLRDRIAVLMGVKPRPDGTAHCRVEDAIVTMRRGFGEKVHTTSGDWVRNGDTLLAREPIASVRLTTPLWIDYSRERDQWRVLFRPASFRAVADQPDFPKTDWYNVPEEANVVEHILPLHWRGIKFEFSAMPSLSQLQEFPASTDDMVDALP